MNVPALANKANVMLLFGYNSNNNTAESIYEFTPQSLNIIHESLATPDSGRTRDGKMHLAFVLNNTRKLEITLPPYPADFDSSPYAVIPSLVQGKVYHIKFFDIAGNSQIIREVYTSNEDAEWLSGVICGGMVRGVEFHAIETSRG